MNRTLKVFNWIAVAWMFGACSLDAGDLVGETVSLHDIVADAVRNNPQLLALKTRWQAMTERPLQERTPPNPMLAYRGMDMTDRYRMPDTAEKRVELEQQFPWFGKLALRAGVAGKEAESMRFEYETMEREIIMTVKEIYFDLYATQQSLLITRAEESVLDRMRRIAEIKYATGQVNQQDVLKAQAEITMIKQRMLELEGLESTLKAKLNQLVNRRPDTPVGAAVTGPQTTISLDLDQLMSIAETNRPEIKRAKTQVARAGLQRQLMKKEFYPDYKLGIEYRGVRDADDMVMFTVGVELPVWRSKYRAGLREADKMIESTAAELAAAQRQTQFDVRDAQVKTLTAQRTLELYKTDLVPQAEARFKSSEAGYQTGKVDFLDLLESERFLLDARLKTVVEEGNLGARLARLERALGAALKLDTANK